ncbi:MAG TPA: porin family protein [candidate division Zixibacteria bacterium]|nr:porin family protein [candidate division Zixibacteria bacterium]
MKKVLAVMMALLFAVAINASAQQTIKASVFVGPGLSMPMGPDDFTDYWGMGFNVGGGVEIQINEMFSIVPRINYNSFGLDEDAFIEELEEELGYSVEGIELDGGSINAIGFGADVKLAVPAGDESKITPYFLGGLGMTSVSFSDLEMTYEGESETMEIDESETDFTVEFGAGMEIAISPKMSLFVDGKYVIIMAEDDNITYVPFHVGLIFGL